MNDDLTPSGCMPLQESEKHLRLVPTLDKPVMGEWQDGYARGNEDGWNECQRTQRIPDAAQARLDECWIKGFEWGAVIGALAITGLFSLFKALA